MRFAAVTGRPGTWTADLCARCGRRIHFDREKVFADLDGQPFRAFYHEPCANEAQREDEQRAKGGQ